MTSGAGQDRSFVRVERAEGLLTITLDRAAKANALSSEMMKDLVAALSDAGSAELILLRSASDKLFCAGADIAQFVAGSSALALQEKGLLALIEAMAGSDVPIVAVARGRASGAGVILLALADVVIGAEDLELAAPEFQFGMYPIIVEAVLQSRLWPSMVSRICLDVSSIKAEEAQSLGLVTEVLQAPGFAETAIARVAYFRQRAAGLRSLRQSRKSSMASQSMLRQLHKVAPLMIENYEATGVRDRILAYLSGLRSK